MPRLAVIGFPVGHSRSPAMQTAALEAAGLGDTWSYGAIEVAPEGFEARVRELAASGEYAGVNVTVPHKEAALALAEEASEEARAIGAANTLVFGPEGIAAHNTDAGGLLGALTDAGWEAARGGAGRAGEPGEAVAPGRRALVLGAGGAARAVCWALAGAGAEVEVWNRTAARAEALAVAGLGAPVLEPDPRAYGLLVNTTAVGLHGEDPFAELPLERGGFGPDQTVVDMVYGERPSLLLAAAAERGAATVDGLEILVQQGALSFEIWTGVAPDLAVMRAAARGAPRR